jgi:hypothetical protein
MEVHYSLPESTVEGNTFSTLAGTIFETVDELFSGKIATSAKTKAKSIASLMQYKMKQDSEGPFITGKQ